MTERESLVAAVAERPGDDATRHVFADWLDDHGEHARADFVRASVEAARKRPGTPRRAALLDRAADLLATNEEAWLGPWSERLIDWDFRRGFLHRVRLTSDAFFRHGEELFRAEPAGRVEVTNDQGGPLEEDAVREVVRHPAFASVRHCAVVRGHFAGASVGFWLRTLAECRHVTGLRRFSAGGMFIGHGAIDPGSLRAFCAAGHLARLRGLDLGGFTLDGAESLHVLINAVFAPALRSLRVALTSEEIRRLAASNAFARLRRLDMRWGRIEPDAWRALFDSPRLAAVESISLPGAALPAYARSPMALRIRDLTVGWAESRGAIPRAWHELIERAPPPRSLTLDNHNPGREVFAALRRSGWLRDVRRLAIRGDSQGGAFNSTAGPRVLFGPKTMPRLASLDLHEACDARSLAVLAKWPALARLESLELGDDYHGRLYPSRLDAVKRPDRLRRLDGVVLLSTGDIERFLAGYPLARLERLHLSFCHYESDPPSTITLAAAEGVVRDARLSRLRELELGFNDMPEIEDRLAHVLADPAVLPRLRRLRISGDRHGERPAALRARFGPRLVD